MDQRTYFGPDSGVVMVRPLLMSEEKNPNGNFRRYREHLFLSRAQPEREAAGLLQISCGAVRI
jgi:hypothetical protein